MNEEFLSQEEIDALLRGDSDTSEPEVESKDDKEDDHLGFPPVPPSNYDGGELPQLNAMEADTLSEIGNISMGSAATALSTMVNRKVNITVPEVFVSTPSLIKDHYPIPCIVVNVEYVKGLSGSNLLVIKERDAAVIGSLMMGEDGTNPPDQLDELYLSAVTEAMNMMMGSASTSMSDLFQMLIDISPPTAEQRDLGEDDFGLGDERPLICVAFRIEIDDLVDSVMLQIIEFEFGRQMVSKLLPPMEEDVAPASVITTQQTSAPAETQAEVSWDALSQAPDPEPPINPGPIQQALGNLNVDLIRDIPVKVRAVLGRTHLPIDSILKLGPGHIMELETLDGEPIDVYANDTLIAKGEVVVIGEQFGVRITQIAAPQDRIDSIR